MKYMNKRVLAALLAVAMTLPAFACGENIESGDDSTAEVSDSANESSADDGSSNDENSDSGADSESGDSQDSAAIEDDGVVIDDNGAQNHKLVFETPENIDDNSIVSTKRAEDGSVYIAKTDINGVVVTEANGSEVTELYTGSTNARMPRTIRRISRPIRHIGLTFLSRKTLSLTAVCWSLRFRSKRIRRMVFIRLRFILQIFPITAQIRMRMQQSSALGSSFRAMSASIPKSRKSLQSEPI